MKTNKAFIRLSQIPSTIMNLKDLSEESKRKIIDTSKYAMSANNEFDAKTVVMRCAIAQMAEQYVAEWMNGHVMHGDEDTSDPWTYAFDVISGPEYYGMRIEVKTHQSESKYITVNTGHADPYPGKQGLNIRPFLEQPQADLIIFFNTRMIDEGVLLEPYMMSDKDSLRSNEIIVKSKFEGYYLNQYVKTTTKNNLNIFYY
ncbi:DNA endonuclease IV [Acinetobacter phage AB1I1M-1]